MTRVCIVCEGQTEVHFIKTCVAPHLVGHGIDAYPILLQAPSGGDRGGNVTVERVAKLIRHQYGRCNRITTLVDFYGFRDRNGRSRAQLETAILEEVRGYFPLGFDDRFVMPYVQMHEFEGLLFSDIEQFQSVLDGWSVERRLQLDEIRRNFDSPEDINNSPETAPSKRLSAVFQGEYRKTIHGPLIAEAIGMDQIRAQCAQFNDWIGRIQTWGTPRA
jgi:hypothetical protein